MNLPHIIDPDNPGQSARTFHCKMIIKHFYLNISAFNAVIPVSDRIHNDFFPCKFGIFGFRNEFSLSSKISMFFYLVTDKIYRLFHNLKNSSFKNFILNHVHLCTNPGFCSLITDKTYPRTLKILLWFFTKQQNRRATQLFPAVG